MLDARPLDTGLEVVADLFGVVDVELVLSPEERGDLRRLDRMDGGAYQRLVDGLQIRLPTEDDVGRVLDLGQAPLVRQAERTNRGQNNVA